MLRLLLRLTPILLLGILSPAYAGDLDELRDSQPANQWQLTKDDARKNIKVWVKHEDGRRFRSYKVSTVLNAPVEKVLEVFHDFDNFPRWFWGVKEAGLIRTVSPTEYYYFRVHHAPLGLPDRDVVIHAQLEPMTAKHPYVLIKRTSDPDAAPMRKGMQRMPAEDSVTTLKPLKINTQTLWEVEGYVDPGSNAPAWAVNAIQRNAPYYSALGLQRWLDMKSSAE